MQNVIISDTDSVYIGLRPILEHMKSQGIEINDTNKNEIILKLANQIQDEAIIILTQCVKIYLTLTHLNIISN